MKDIFDSLTPEERNRINDRIRALATKRDEERYLRLEKAEAIKQAFVYELELIEYHIAENDQWFLDAKEKRCEVTKESQDLHRKKAEELYSRKRAIDNSCLPAAESALCRIVAQIELEERQENTFQQRDLERLLGPVYEQRERENSLKIFAEFKERERQRGEEEARREEAYAELLIRLREEERERQKEVAAQRHKKHKEQIRSNVLEREIPYLVHFTPLANLTSILQYGLRARSRLAGHNYFCTDKHRTDGWLDWISASVSFPNYKMFYSKRNSLKGVDGWVVLLIRRDVLWELNCKYILTNAARSGIRMFAGARWSSSEAFEEMFGHNEHRIDIPDFYTTDPQAEVMVYGEIPSRYFEMVAVENAQDEQDARRLGYLTGVRVEIRPKLFKWRSDFEHWYKCGLSAFSSTSVTSPF